MIIRDKDYGEFDTDLGDDGTLDTVVGVWHKDNYQEIRFGDTSHLRDENGAMTEDGFAELAKESVEAYIKQYLI